MVVFVLFILYCELQDLPTDDRDEHVLTCLQHFREIGLVMQRKVLIPHLYQNGSPRKHIFQEVVRSLYCVD